MKKKLKERTACTPMQQKTEAVDRKDCVKGLLLADA